MIPSANSSWNSTVPNYAGDHHHWSDHPAQPAAAPAQPAYRHQVLDWENAMLLAASATSHQHATNESSSSMYDNLAEYKPSINNLMHTDAITALSSHSRHNYEGLLFANNLNSSSNVNNAVTWPGLLNTVCPRNSIPCSAGQHENSFIQAVEGAPYGGYESLHGPATVSIGGYSTLPGTAGGGSAVYAGDLLGSSRSSNFGLSSFDQRRLEDILMKRELYSTHDFNSRLGLNLGGRTYFSAADDFAFARFSKRMRPNSPGCVMQPAPLCQAEGCKADLSMAKHYHRRHKVCEYHSKASTVHIGDQTQRFCQQCSRFHVLSEFDDGKRSCRKRLADHNRRRRKPQPPAPPPAHISASASEVPATSDDVPSVASDPGATAAGNHQSKDSQDVHAATEGDHSAQLLVEMNGVCSGKLFPCEAVEDEPQTALMSNEEAATKSNTTKVMQHAGDRRSLEKNGSSPKAPAAAMNNEIKTVISSNTSDRPPSAGVSNQLAASLSLGAMESLQHDVRSTISAGGAISPAGTSHVLVEAGSGPHELYSKNAALNGNTRSSVKNNMRWLQAACHEGSCKTQHPVPALPFNVVVGSQLADQTVCEQSSEHPPSQYIAAAALAAGRSCTSTERASSTDQAKSHNSSSWVLKSMQHEVAEPDGPLNVNAAVQMVKPSGNSGAGSHDLLHLLGDEKNLFNSNKQHHAPTGLGANLAFLDHSLDIASASFRSKGADHHQQSIPFSSLHDEQVQQQVEADVLQLGHELMLRSQPLNMSGHSTAQHSTTTTIFGSRNHWI